MVGDISKLLELPLELWRNEILSHIDLHWLKSLALASKQLHMVVLPLLFRTINVGNVMSDDNPLHLCHIQLADKLRYCRKISLILRIETAKQNSHSQDNASEQALQCQAFIDTLLERAPCNALKLRLEYVSSVEVQAGRVAQLLTILKDRFLAYSRQMKVEVELWRGYSLQLQHPSMVQHTAKIAQDLLQSIVAGVWHIVSLEIENYRFASTLNLSTLPDATTFSHLRRLSLIDTSIPVSFWQNGMCEQVAELEIRYEYPRDGVVSKISQLQRMLQVMRQIESLDLTLTDFTLDEEFQDVSSSLSWTTPCLMDRLSVFSINDSSADVGHLPYITFFLQKIVAPALITLSIDGEHLCRALRGSQALFRSNYPSLDFLRLFEALKGVDEDSVPVTKSDFDDMADLVKACGDRVIVLYTEIAQCDDCSGEAATYYTSRVEHLLSRIDYLSDTLVEISVMVGPSNDGEYAPTRYDLHCPELLRVHICLNDVEILYPIFIEVEMPVLQEIQLEICLYDGVGPELIFLEILELLGEGYMQCRTFRGSVWTHSEAHWDASSEAGKARIRLELELEKRGIENKLQYHVHHQQKHEEEKEDEEQEEEDEE